MIKNNQRGSNSTLAAARVTHADGLGGPDRLWSAIQEPAVPVVRDLQLVDLLVAKELHAALSFAKKTDIPTFEKMYRNQWENADLRSESLNISTVLTVKDLVVASSDAQQNLSPCFKSA